MNIPWTLLIVLSLALMSPRASGMHFVRSLGAGVSALSITLIAAVQPAEDGDDDTPEPAAAAELPRGESENENDNDSTASTENEGRADQPGAAPDLRRSAPPIARDGATRPSSRGTASSREDRRLPSGNRPSGSTTSDRRNRDLPSSPSRRDANPSRNSRRSNERSTPNQATAPSETTAHADFAAYKLIADRNIFNTTRSPRRAQAPSENRRSAPAETITLVGILSYEKGSFAFFDGSGSQRQKVLEPGGTLASYKVAEIAPDAVKLQASTNSLELRIGMKLQKGEEGWEVVGGAPGSTSGDRFNSRASDSSGDETDVVKRLMQQREQETK